MFIFIKKTRNMLKEKYQTDKFFIAFGDMKRRKQTYEHYVSNAWEAVNFIHPNTVVSTGARLEKGVLIECGCLITPNPIIGDNVVVNTGSQVNHDNIIENHVYIASGVILSGGVTIYENTLLDDGGIVTLGHSVGKNSLIGAGGVVPKDILPMKNINRCAKLSSNGFVVPVVVKERIRGLPTLYCNCNSYPPRWTIYPNYPYSKNPLIISPILCYTLINRLMRIIHSIDKRRYAIYGSLCKPWEKRI